MTTHTREIVYSREDRDYKMILDGECVGFARTYTQAERTLDELVLELIEVESAQE